MVLKPGEPAPWFAANCTSNTTFHFSTMAGRYIVLTFFGSAGDPSAMRFLNLVVTNREIFNDDDFCFFGVSNDPQDQERLNEVIPGIRFFWDEKNQIAQLFGAMTKNSPSLFRHSLVLDFRLRVIAVIPFESPEGHLKVLYEILSRLPLNPAPAIAHVQAPILVVPHVFEPDFCCSLMNYYDQANKDESGFMRDVDGKTVGMINYSFKRRTDAVIEDEALRRECMIRIHDRLVPEIYKAFQVKISRIERYIVACYEADTQGFFRAHRDNTTRGTAHRQFAVSLHLNTGEYEGGYLRFPEFGNQLYTAPPGGAVVFSCSLLHEAMPVTAGRRFMFLPFLYNEESAAIRQKNLEFLEAP